MKLFLSFPKMILRVDFPVFFPISESLGKWEDGAYFPF